MLGDVVDSGPIDDVGGALVISKRLVGGDPEQPRSQGIVVALSGESTGWWPGVGRRND